MRMRGLCCRPVSVRVSVTLMHCIQTVEDNVKLLSRSGAYYSSFFYPSARTHFQGERLQRGHKMQAVVIFFAIFE